MPTEASMPLLSLPVGWVVVLNVTGWPVIQFGLAWLFTRLPEVWFLPPRPAVWEADGRVYERWVGIKRWKDRLPDAARWFGGGFPKGSLASIDCAYVERFVRETWRGEGCHWVAMAFTPLFFLWNPWWADAVMVFYAVAANLPCILVQRYNRVRLLRLLSKPRLLRAPGPGSRRRSPGGSDNS